MYSCTRTRDVVAFLLYYMHSHTRTRPPHAHTHVKHSFVAIHARKRGKLIFRENERWNYRAPAMLRWNWFQLNELLGDRLCCDADSAISLASIRFGCLFSARYSKPVWNAYTIDGVLAKSPQRIKCQVWRMASEWNEKSFICNIYSDI